MNRDDASGSRSPFFENGVEPSSHAVEKQYRHGSWQWVLEKQGRARAQGIGEAGIEQALAGCLVRSEQCIGARESELSGVCSGRPEPRGSSDKFSSLECKSAWMIARDVRLP